MDRELHIRGGHNIFDLHTSVFGLLALVLDDLVDDLGVLPACQGTLVLRFGPSDDHLATLENKRCSFRLLQSHNDSSKSIRIVLSILSL